MAYKRRVKKTCGACGADRPISYGIPDPCLGTLPGVSNACCGHGDATKCYVQEPGRPTRRGEDARLRQRYLGGDPHAFMPQGGGWISR